ncbi:acyltransferase [Sphingomonas sanguinis]|uniref:acyltransferase family protein n=1 Tax=Sphingomonas sanguinis TaxID=33051 RepID=UPI001C58A169|nr:acyltransferase [Sphingomonas sanguinis]QXT35529.1 acyltransferase [Sphingomonas sanguinis]
MTQEAKDSGLLPGVQLLRGLSALLVVATHANLILEHSRFLGHVAYRGVLNDAGLFGVSIFFVISGFIIALVSLDDRWLPRLTRTDFARRRFVRIVPFLWVCVIGYNLLSLVSTHAVEWGPMLRALSVWPVGELKPNVVWSLRHEFLFYGLFLILVMGRRRHFLPLVLWFLAPLLCWPLVPLLGVRPPEELGGWSELFRVVFLGANGGANLQFGAGFLLGLLALRRHPVMAQRGFGLIAPLLATIAVALIVDRLALPNSLGRSLVWTALAVPPVWLAITCRARAGWFKRAGLALGDSSFALYLVHNPILLIVMQVARRLHLIGHPLFLPAAVAMAVLGGWVAHRLIERPLIRALAHGRPLAPWLRRRRSAPPSGAAAPGPAD